MIRNLIDGLGITLIVGALWYWEPVIGGIATGTAILIINGYFDRRGG